MNAEAPSGTYPGNPSLPVEVREKIVSTFRHTLDLYRDGKLDDCLIGCDFILKMDPRFAPARKLQEKARNPRADVDIADLQSVTSAPAPVPHSPPRETGSDTGGVKPRRRDTGSVAALGATVTPAVRRETAPVEPPDAPFPASDARDSIPVEGLEDLSLDSLSLDGPLSDLNAPAGGEAGLPFEASDYEQTYEPTFEGLSQGPFASDPALASPEQPSPADEIAALLRKGDDARNAGDQQQAIEIWSRIFLIDINNADAVSRIEDARREMAEESRRIAASLDKGAESFAKGDLTSARKQFDAVLSLGEEPPATAATPVAAMPAPVVPSTPSGLPPHDLSAVAAPGDVLAEELEQSGPPGGRRSWTSIPRPPLETPAEEVATPPAPGAAKRLALKIPPRVAIIAGAGLVAVAIAAFFMLRSTGAEPRPARGESGPSLEHATRLFQEGKIDETTAELKRIPPESPDYARAQKLLASLTDSKPAAAAPAPAGAPAAPGVAPSANPAALRADAERALGEKRYIDAMKSFSLAAPHFQSDPTFAQQMAAASERVSELTPAVKLYNDGEYETAIPMLWRLYQADRSNQDARSYLMRSYYNQGILQLQNGLFDKSKESFSEVLALDPQDVEAARHRQFAERYKSGDLDLRGRIYVRYISPRP